MRLIPLFAPDGHLQACRKPLSRDGVIEGRDLGNWCYSTSLKMLSHHFDPRRHPYNQIVNTWNDETNGDIVEAILGLVPFLHDPEAQCDVPALPAAPTDQSVISEGPLSQALVARARRIVDRQVRRAGCGTVRPASRSRSPLPGSAPSGRRVCVVPRHPRPTRAGYGQRPRPLSPSRGSDGAATPARTMPVLCANTNCQFLVDEDASFGGYCCRKCHWRHSSGSKGGKQHESTCIGCMVVDRNLKSDCL